MRRDAEALRLARSRAFAGAYLVSLELELQTRRLVLRLYGSLAGGSGSELGTLTFFGVAALALENADDAFPQAVRLDSLAIAMDDPEDAGTATIAGERGWRLAFDFDGLAYEEHAAVLASLADDL